MKYTTVCGSSVEYTFVHVPKECSMYSSYNRTLYAPDETGYEFYHELFHAYQDQRWNLIEPYHSIISVCIRVWFPVLVTLYVLVPQYQLLTTYCILATLITLSFYELCIEWGAIIYGDKHKQS
jgi:hypothetical protein